MTHSPSPSCHAPTAPTAPASDAPVYMGLPHERVLRPRFYVALALTLPVLVLAMGPMLFPSLAHTFPFSPALSAWLQLALTTPVFFWSGWFFIRRWAKSLSERDPNMFTLTVTGTGAAYLYSVSAVLFGHHFPDTLHTAAHGIPLYFEATAFITTIVLLGQILEQRAHARTDAAIRALMDLAPSVAHRVAADGHEQDVPLADILVADTLRVRPGEKVPVDGTLTDGAMESAGLVLVKGDLRALVRAVHLSRATLRNIKQNLFWAFAYNTAGIPLAAGLLVPFFGWSLNPMFAGAAMSLSSISVVANALRLRHAKL